MSYLNPPYENNFKELCAAMPLFYLEVFEMREILKAQGRLMDDVCAGFEKTIDDNFILQASEETIAIYEDFLELTPEPGMSLDERRKVVIATMYRTPHIGEPEMQEIFHIFCNGGLTISVGSGTVELIVDIAEGQFLNVPGFLGALKRQIPAHLSLAVVFESRVGIIINTSAKGYRYRTAPTGIPLAGTLPQRNTVGAPYHAPIEIETRGQGFGYHSPEAGTIPWRDMLAGIERSNIAIEGAAKGFGYKSPATDTVNAGEYPNRSTVGGLEDSAVMVEAAAGGCPYSSPAAGTKPSRNIMFEATGEQLNIDTGAQGFGYRSGMTGQAQAGKSPARSTIFDESGTAIQAATRAQGFVYASILTGIPEAGKKPYTATQGGSQAEEINIGAAAKGFRYSTQAAGETEKAGKVPYTEKGASAHGSAFCAVAEGVAYRYTVTLCGLSYCNKRSIRR